MPNEITHPCPNINRDLGKLPLKLITSHCLSISCKYILQKKYEHAYIINTQWIIVMTSSNGSIFRVTCLSWGEPPVTGGIPSQRPVMWSFDVFFDLRLNKWSRRRWFEAPSHWLWRRSNDSSGLFHWLWCNKEDTRMHNSWVLLYALRWRHMDVM